MYLGNTAKSLRGGWTDRQADRQINEWINGQRDWWLVGWINRRGWMDRWRNGRRMRKEERGWSAGKWGSVLTQDQFPLKPFHMREKSTLS